MKASEICRNEVKWLTSQIQSHKKSIYKIRKNWKKKTTNSQKGNNEKCKDEQKLNEEIENEEIQKYRKTEK